MSIEKPAKAIRPRNDELLNYLLRPAKNIERKMLCEALSRLSIISKLSNYLYVGFGSTYFADFILFHKALGIQKLISIEGDDAMEERVRFNNPYSCIDILIGQSTEMLPEVPWEKQKSILWLDYTSTLEGYMFNDMATFFNRAQSGSVFIISVNVDIQDQTESKTTNEKIKKKLEKDSEVKKRIHNNQLKKDLKKENYYSIIRGVIHEEILDIINARNKIESIDKLNYKQIFNFLYKDGAAMLTIGGILFSEKDRDKISKMTFENMDFFKDKDEYFEIIVPNLTSREIKTLDKYLPNINNDALAKKQAQDELKNVISNDVIDKYSKIYRYFPYFTETNL